MSVVGRELQKRKPISYSQAVSCDAQQVLPMA